MAREKGTNKSQFIRNALGKSPDLNLAQINDLWSRSGGDRNQGAPEDHGGNFPVQFLNPASAGCNAGSLACFPRQDWGNPALPALGLYP